MSETLPEVIREIKESIKAIQRVLDELVKTNTRQERDHEYIHEHRAILFGDANTIGLIAKVEALMRMKQSLEKALWYVIVPLLTAIGAGIAYLVALGVAHG